MPKPDHQPPTLNAIGCGRVGQTLLRLWHAQGSFAIGDVLTQALPSAQRACAWVGAGTPVADLHAMRNADIWMLAVPDAQLGSAAQALAAALATRAEAMPTLVFHCSGALAASELAPLSALGAEVASAHCLLSFASPDLAVAQFAGTACALEGDARAQAVLHQHFTAIGAQCFAIASTDKLRYHAAAVFATNFLPVLQATAEDLWRSSGVPAALIPQLRASLLRNAVHNITERGPRAALTGPAARGDLAAIARQADALHAWDVSTGAAYQALSTLALRLAQKHDPDQFENGAASP